MKVYIAFFLFVFMIADFCIGEGFMLGYSRDKVIKELGSPVREIETGSGLLLFYGSVFIELENDRVLFINVGNKQALEQYCLADAMRGIYWGKYIARRHQAEQDKETDNNARKMTNEEQKEWAEKKKRKQEMVAETRARHFLLNRTFKTIFIENPAMEIYAAPLFPVSGIGYCNFLSGRSVSVLGIKDSRGISVPVVGEEHEYVDRHIDIKEGLHTTTSP